MAVDLPVEPQSEPAGVLDSTHMLPYHGGENGVVTRRFITLLACRLLALWSLVDSLPRLVMLAELLFRSPSSLSAGSSGQALLIAVVPLAIELGIFSVLWFLCPWLADRISGEHPQIDEPLVPTQCLNEDAMLRVAMVAVGAVVMAGALPEILRVLVVLADSGSIPIIWRPEAYMLAARLLIACFLLLTPSRVVRLLRRLSPDDSRAAAVGNDSDGPL